VATNSGESREKNVLGKLGKRFKNTNKGGKERAVTRAFRENIGVDKKGSQGKPKNEKGRKRKRCAGRGGTARNGNKKTKTRKGVWRRWDSKKTS